MAEPNVNARLEAFCDGVFAIALTLLIIDVSRSSAAFIYANGLLLLTVVFVPFPTALLGDYFLTDHAAPAVVLYDAVRAVQALSSSGSRSACV